MEICGHRYPWAPFWRFPRAKESPTILCPHRYFWHCLETCKNPFALRHSLRNSSRGAWGDPVWEDVSVALIFNWFHFKLSKDLGLETWDPAPKILENWALWRHSDLFPCIFFFLSFGFSGLLPGWLEARTSDGLANVGTNRDKALWSHFANRADVWINDGTVWLAQASWWLPWSFAGWEVAHLTCQESSGQQTAPLPSGLAVDHCLWVWLDLNVNFKGLTGRKWCNWFVINYMPNSKISFETHKSKIVAVEQALANHGLRSQIIFQ